MKPIDSSDPLTRRKFLNQTTSGAAAVAVVGPVPFLAPARAATPLLKMIGIQVGAVSSVDEGIEQVLDIFQERGAVKHDFPDHFHLRPRPGRATDSRAAVSRPWRPGVRRGNFPGRQLRRRACGLLPRHCLETDTRSGPRRA